MKAFNFKVEQARFNLSSSEEASQHSKGITVLLVLAGVPATPNKAEESKNAPLRLLSTVRVNEW